MKIEISRRQALLRAGLFAGGSLFATSLLTTRAFADGEGQDQKVTVQELSKNLHVIMGAGGNIGLLTGETGVMIDAGYKQFHDAIISEAGKISPAAIGVLINTHWHGDHTDGNASYGSGGARIIGHVNTRKRLSTDQTIDFLNAKSPASPKIALPIVTFNDSMTLFINDEEIEMTHVEPAHTDSDIVVHFKNANVIHCGDLFFNGMYPFIDYSSKGWIGGMAAAAAKIVKMSDDKTKLIPGHGPVATKAEFVAYKEMLEDVAGKIIAMVQAGKTVEEAIAAKPTEKYDDKLGKGFIPAARFIPLVYKGIVEHNK